MPYKSKEKLKEYMRKWREKNPDYMTNWLKKHPAYFKGQVRSPRKGPTTRKI